MLGYFNKKALSQTLETKEVTFYSRSKQRLWIKGENSGNFLKMETIYFDCDKDSLLLLVKAPKETCHLGQISCFGSTEFNYLNKLEKTIKNRLQSSNQKSYIQKLNKQGLNKIAQKVGEEGLETAIAAVAETNENCIHESADLIFHLLVLLNYKNLNFKQILFELESRSKKE